MSLNILHSSDLHGRYKMLIEGHADTEFDVWLDTGDFLPNVGRVQKTQYQIWDHTERSYQSRWIGYKSLASRIAAWLNGRPAILMPGNHDFILLAPYLLKAGVDVHMVTTDGVTVAGLKWAGFREVHQVNATQEWMGEVDKMDADATFRSLVETTLASNPDVLVTHSPPSNILNGRGEGYGISQITQALAYQAHEIRAHFFGHDHESGGQQVTEMGVQFFNGAEKALVHELSF